MKYSAMIFILGMVSFFSMASMATPADVSIETITTSGEGCPDGQTAVTIAPDQKSFSVLFDQLISESSPSKTSDQKMCTLTLTTRVPAGWKYVLHADDFRGFAQADKGSQSALRVFYYWLNPKNRWVLLGKNEKNYSNGFNDNFTLHRNLKVLQPQKQRFEEHIETVHLQIQLKSRANAKKTASTQIALDSFDGRIEGVKQSCGY